MNANVRYTIRDSSLIALMTFPGSTLKLRAVLTMDEFKRVLAELPLDEPRVRESLARWGVRVSEDDTVSGDDVGFSFRKFTRGLKRFAKKVAASKAFKMISSVLSNPIISALIPIPLGRILTIASKTSEALGAARRGDPAALAALATAVDTARGGDPLMAKGLALAAKATGQRPTELLAAAADVPPVAK
jgi:hypothetical protein